MLPFLGALGTVFLPKEPKKLEKLESNIQSRKTVDVSFLPKKAYNEYMKEYMRKKNGWKLVKKRSMEIDGRDYMLLIYENAEGELDSKLEKYTPSLAEVITKIWRGT